MAFNALGYCWLTLPIHGLMAELAIRLSSCRIAIGGSVALATVFHPAIVSGVLLGCWERAYGRNGRSLVAFVEGRTTLELRSSREIAS